MLWDSRACRRPDNRVTADGKPAVFTGITHSGNRNQLNSVPSSRGQTRRLASGFMGAIIVIVALGGHIRWAQAVPLNWSAKSTPSQLELNQNLRTLSRLDTAQTVPEDWIAGLLPVGVKIRRSEKADSAPIIWPLPDKLPDQSSDKPGIQQNLALLNPSANKLKNLNKTVPARRRLSAADCQAAGAFIQAGAQARDKGVSSKRFLSQLRLDLMVLARESPNRRWFLHSPLQAKLLHTAAREIYASPHAPAWHRNRFITACDTLRASARMR